jgi:hypothetical protein
VRFNGGWILAGAIGSLILCAACWLFVSTLMGTGRSPTPLNICLDTRGVQIVLERPFGHRNGLLYLADVHTDTFRVPSFFKWKLLSNLSLGPPDTVEAPTRATSVLCEDDKQLGPPHALHADIASLGHGRFSQWGHGLYFSSSDGSDPNVNGRTYKAIEP